MAATPQSPGTISVSKLGYVEFESPDVDTMVDYYTRVLDFTLVERPDSEAYLTTSFDHHAVVIKKGDVRGRSAVGYEIFEDLGSALGRLKDAGYEAERRSDISPSTPDVIILEEPMTKVPIHLFDQQSGSGLEGYSAVRPTKLGHVAAFVPELNRMRSFYQDLLGFKWSDSIEDFFVFLRCNPDHHTANFMASTKRQGMHHIAYEMRDPNHLQTMIEHLAANGYRLEWGPGRHGPGHNMFTYHHDPDGHLIELFTQLDVVFDESRGNFEPRPWHTEFPSYPKTWQADLISANMWGPQNPAGDLLAR